MIPLGYVKILCVLSRKAQEIVTFGSSFCREVNIVRDNCTILTPIKDQSAFFGNVAIFGNSLQSTNGVFIYFFENFTQHFLGE